MRGDMLCVRQQSANTGGRERAVKSGVFVCRPDDEIAVGTGNKVRVPPTDHVPKSAFRHLQREDLTLSWMNRNLWREPINRSTPDAGREDDLPRRYDVPVAHHPGNPACIAQDRSDSSSRTNLHTASPA